MKFTAEAIKNLAISCTFFGVAAVAGVVLISNLNKPSEQVGADGKEPVEVPYTSSSDLNLGIVGEITAYEEGEKSAALGAEQLAQATTARVVNNPAGNSSNETPVNPSNNESGENDNPVDDGYLHELDGHDTDKLYMQDITTEMIENWAYQSVHTVVDRRTDIEYEVYKGYDGNGSDTLYMASNLRLGSDEKDMLLTSKNTNIYSDYVMPAGSDQEGTYMASVVVADRYPDKEWFTVEDYSAYNLEESICPAGWRLPAFFENFRNSDMNSITSFSRETALLKNTIELNDNSLLASSTIRLYGEDYVLAAEGDSYNEVAFDSDTALKVKCMFGDPLVVTRHFVFDFNGGVDYNDETGEYDLTRFEGDATFVTRWGLTFDPGFYPEKEGYTFIGWAKDKNATEPESDPSDGTITFNPRDGKNLTYYAIYKKDVVITFNANGGTFEYDNPTATVNVAVYTPSPIKTISSKKVDGTRKTSGEDMSTYMDGYAEYNELDFGYDGPVRMHMIYNVADGDVLCMNESGTTKQDHLNQLNSTNPSCFFFQGDYPLTMPGSLNLPIMYLENNTIETAALFKGSRLGIAFYSLASSENFGDEYGYYVEATISRGAKEGHYDIPYNDDEEKRFVGWATSPDATVPEYEAMDDMNNMVGRSIDFIREDTTLYAVWGNQVAH